MPESEDVPRLVIRPSAKRYRRALRTAPAFLLVFVTILVLSGGLANLVGAAIVAAVCLGVIAGYLHRVAVVVTPNELIRVGMTGRSSSWPRGEIGGLLRVRLPASVAHHQVFDNLFVLDRAGRTLIRLRDSIWTESDLDRLASALGREPEVLGVGLTAPELARRYPRAVPLHERRPWAFSLAAAGAIIGFVIVFALVLSIAFAH